MKAVRYHGPRNCRCEEIGMPVPGPDDVLIRVRAAGICGTDLEVYDGIMFYFTSGMTRTPITPGHEWSGEVAEVGRNVRTFKVGDRVTAEVSIGCGKCPLCKRGWYNQCPNRTETGLLNRDGGFAEYIVMPANNVFSTPTLSFAQAATIEPAGIALYPTKLARVSPEDYVVVVGSGPIGLFMVQTARAYGAKKVILVGSRADRLQVGRNLGADVAIDFRAADLTARVMDATDGHGADVVLEAVGHPSVWEIIVSVLAPRARVMMTGLFAGKTCSVLWDPLVVKNITIMGTVGAPNCWAECIDLHARGIIRTDGIITHTLPLTKFVDGIEMVRNRTDGTIKIVLEP
jgi:L-iditol 2-dehydrogenase